MADKNLKKNLALREQKVVPFENPKTKPKAKLDGAKINELKELAKKAKNSDEDLFTFKANKISGETGFGLDWVLTNKNADAKKNRTSITITDTSLATLKRITGIAEDIPAYMILDNILREFVKMNSKELKRRESKIEKKAYE